MNVRPGDENARGTPARRALEELARRRGVSTAYTDNDGRRRRTPSATLVAVLGALGEEVDREEVVVVAWGGVLRPKRVEKSTGQRTLNGTLRNEDGTERASLAVRVDDKGSLAIDEPLPFGVHELRLDSGVSIRVISAPERLAQDTSERASWGVFAPTYALRDRRNRPAGDLTCLRSLGELVAPLGARLVATLPLLAELATADGAQAGQQPYAPLSRMFWNEAYLDLARLPELEGVKLDLIARDDPSLPPGHADLAGLASAARPALSEAARRLGATSSPRRQALRAFVGDHPDLERYARFRAALELRGVERRNWPTAWREGHIAEADVPAEAVARHVYAQWAMDTQLGEDAAQLARKGCGLLLDLPVGCQPNGYDVWAYPHVFATGASIGAPPDAFFTSGQDWGFAPPLPDGERRAGYPVFRKCLAHSLAHAGALRVDHIMGLSRLWWVPRGMPASDGVYVRYRFDELLAVACLEAWRWDADLIGEDLGTVERGLTTRLRQRGVSGMRVACFDLGRNLRAPLAPPKGSVAYVDTHDTATFAGFVQGYDIDERERIGVESERAASEERASRTELVTRLAERLIGSGRLAKAARADPVALLGALLEELGEAPSELIIVPLEDLWGEREAQNIPGTTTEHANFSRRCALTLEEFAASDAALAPLRRLDKTRRLRQPRRRHEVRR